MTSTTDTPFDSVTVRSVGNRVYPAANVKIHRSWRDVIAAARRDDYDYDLCLGDDGPAFLDWLEAALDEDDAWERFGCWDEAAQEQGWEDAQEYARDFFGRPTMKVWSDGRSGGWLYTTDLGSVESWLLIDAGPHFADDEADREFAIKWAEYEAWATERAQFCADEAVTLLYLNVWEGRDSETPRWHPPVSRHGYWS